MFLRTSKCNWLESGICAEYFNYSNIGDKIAHYESIDAHF